MRSSMDALRPTQEGEGTAMEIGAPIREFSAVPLTEPIPPTREPSVPPPSPEAPQPTATFEYEHGYRAEFPRPVKLISGHGDVDLYRLAQRYGIAMAPDVSS
jgi:hypothetical protein